MYVLLQAGIPDNSLSIALEPEGASLYCRQVPVEAQQEGYETSLSSFCTGDRYIVVDAGGKPLLITDFLWVTCAENFGFGYGNI